MINTYYFDASDNGPNNTTGWTNPGNAFNGNITDFATKSATVSMNATGTNSPTAGTSIEQVRARMYGYIDGSTTLSCQINYTAENLGVIGPMSNTTASWSSYIILSEPSGGWTWQKVNDLNAALYKSNVSTGTVYVAKMEIEVTSEDIIAKISGMTSISNISSITL